MMNNLNNISFNAEQRSKSLHYVMQNRQLYQKYLREVQEDQQEETLQQISQYVQKNCKYLQKYFEEHKESINQCGGRHNEMLTSLYQAREYQKIDSKVYSTSALNFSSLLKPINKIEKVVIKRKILNDYMNIINKRQEVMNEIEENFIQLFEMHQGTLHYYNKYYSKQNQKQYNKLLNILLPEFRYILKFVSNKGRQFESRLRNYSDVRHDKIKTRVGDIQTKRNKSEGQRSSSQFAQSPDGLQKSRTRNKKSGNDAPNKRQTTSDDGDDYESQKKQYVNALQKKAQFQKTKFENLAKTKGYFYLENTDSIDNKYSNFEMQKYGSDKMKLKLFEKDMKQIIKEKKKSENINASQESTKKLSSASLTASLSATASASASATARSQEKQVKSPSKYDKINDKSQIETKIDLN